MTPLILLASALILCCGPVCLALGRNAGRAVFTLMAPASFLGLAASCMALWSGETYAVELPLSLPLGNCLFQVDPLASIFLIPLFLVSGLAALAAPGRMRLLDGQLRHGKHGFFFCLLSGGMGFALTAADGILFLIIWEVMSLAPFFLLAHKDKTENDRYAGWIYLVAAHIGALPLLLLFAWLTVRSGSSAFSAYLAMARGSGASVFFILAFVGFGAKCGLVPLHIWMPETYPAAPGHVAALLSGAMMNMGLYGIFRVLNLLGPGEIWWAYALMGAGAFSGVIGILLGAAQADMKRALAYSSSENAGIICMALGAGLLAGRHGASGAAALLLAGSFLHIWNHSVFKSLLFLAATAVAEGTRTTIIQRLGGLHKRIPLTGGCFAIGCAAIAGMPPFNGFMSEMLIYLGFALGSEATRGAEAALFFWAAFFILGSIAGISLLAFTRVFGLSFLGSPRGAESLEAREPESALRQTMIFLAASCLGLSLAGPFLLHVLQTPLHWFTRGLALPVPLSRADFILGDTVLSWYAVIGVLLLVVFSFTAWARNALLAKNHYEEGLTWDCGYRMPTARIQYSGGSFAHTLAVILHPLMRSRLAPPKIAELFPASAQARMETPDWPTGLWHRIIFRPVAFVSEWFKDMQRGLVNVYILYILIALVIALAWALGFA